MSAANRTSTHHDAQPPATTTPSPTPHDDDEDGQDSPDESCSVCGVRTATRRGPTSVNGRIFINEPLCEGCAADLVPFTRHAVKTHGYSEHIVDDLGLSIYQVSKALGPGAAVRASVRRNDL